MKNSILLILLLSGIHFLNAQILIDERYDDWTNGELIYTDALNDVPDNRVDLHRLWVSNDADNIYIRFTIDNFKIDVQDGNNITIYIDYDQDNTSGERFLNIGAELIYSFGNKTGNLYSEAGSEEIDQFSIRVIGLPTVTATDFEIAIRRRNRSNGEIVQPSERINIVLKDGSTGDQIPEANETLSYTLNTTTESFSGPYSIDRPRDTDLRIMSLNALRDQITEPSRRDNYERVVQAIAPDIIAFQEIYDSGAGDISELLDQWYPHPSGPWLGGKVGSDIILCSPYPIKESANIRGNGLFLVDYKGQDILIVNAHLFCCDNDLGRQEEVDDIMAFIRRAKQGQGLIPLADDTPIIILGDMNFVGFDGQRNTILTGDIDDENRFGSDFTPDWDGTAFSMSDTYTTGTPFTYTWVGSSRFAPGRLDYIFYSDAVMEDLNSFALNTNTMPVIDRVTYDLNLSDSEQLSDHLAIVTDFDILSLVDVEEVSQDESLIIYPNPVKESISLLLPQIAVNRLLSLQITNAQGKILYSSTIQSPQRELRLDDVSLPVGVFTLSIRDKGRLIASELIMKK